MTREKKEILKKIEEMEMWIELDRQLSYGYEPPGAHDHVFIWKIKNAADFLKN